MTVFDPVDASSTYEETVVRLGTAIRVGVLPPGSKLPPERELADQLQISRSTLRQALATLTEQGHLTALRGRLGGTFVVEEPPLASEAPFPMDEWRALLDGRLALELGAVQLAVERATEEQLDRLEAACDSIEGTLDGDFPAYRRADIAFHLLIAEAAGAPRLVAELTQIQGRLCDLLHIVGLPERAREDAIAEHRLVLSAMQDGDAVRAIAEMRAHLEATEFLLAGAVLS
jgi:GntR family transcriptional repressor for pyruvate dehydrogenase complex